MCMPYHVTPVSNMASELCCQVCGKKQQVLKRCTRCQEVFYCSRDCQVIDWPEHKTCCNNIRKPPPAPSYPPSSGRLIERAQNPVDQMSFCSPDSPSGLVQSTTKKPFIWQAKNSSGDDASMTSAGRKDGKSSTHSCQNLASAGVVDSTSMENLPGIRSSGKIKCAFSSKDKFRGVTDSSSVWSPKDESYGNQIKKSISVQKKEHDAISWTDVPIYNPDTPGIKVTVKAHKEKVVLNLNKHWSGEDAMKFVSKAVQVPMARLRLITRGKVVNQETFWTVTQDRAVFQAIGEKAEDEEGLESSDIDLLMQQMSVERNNAIKALREGSGNVIDAIMYLGNK